jgi:putative peptidoglycan lipid II flippase
MPPDPQPAAQPGPASKTQTSFVGAAKVVSILTFISRITGLLRDGLLSAALGMQGVGDAFTMGFTLPNLFRRLFGEGALTAAFIPVYTELHHKDPAMARKLGSLCLLVVGALLATLTLLVMAFIALCLKFMNLSEYWTLIAQLSLIMIPYMPMVCLVAIIGAMLQVHGRFAPSAGMPIFMNATTILGIIVAYVLASYADLNEANDIDRTEDLKRHIAFIVAWSVPVSGLIQLISQGLLLRRIERFTSDFSGASEHLWKIAFTMVPMLIALSVLQINTAADSVITAFLSRHADSPDKLFLFGRALDYPVEEGGVAAMARASMLYQFPLGVFGIAIATAIFPTLARAAAEVADHGWDHFRKVLRQGLRLTMFIGLPASVGLILIRIPAARTMFEWGNTHLSDALRIAAILAGFAPAIWAYSMTHVITRAFYAVKDTKTPVKISVAMVALNITLNLILIWPFGVAGLAAATAICAVIQNAAMLYMLRRHSDKIVDYAVVKGWLTTAACSAIMAAALWPITFFFNPATLSKKAVAVELAIMIAIGGAVFLAAAKFFKCEELDWLLNRKKKTAPPLTASEPPGA